MATDLPQIKPDGQVKGEEIKSNDSSSATEELYPPSTEVKLSGCECTFKTDL